jgi:predicted O-methyltransferase YrrM
MIGLTRLSKLLEFTRGKKYARFVKKKNMEYIDTITSHLTIKEKLKLYQMAKYKLRQGSGVFVEIGSYLGVSSCFIALALSEKKHTGKLYCIDTWQNDAMSEGPRDTYDEFINNSERFREEIIPVRQRSIEAAKEFDQQIDYLFIDGDHSYGAVKNDWEAWSPKLNHGAVVIFHDYGWAEGVMRVIHESVMQHVSPFDNLPNMWWGWISY